MSTQRNLIETMNALEFMHFAQNLENFEKRIPQKGSIRKVHLKRRLD